MGKTFRRRQANAGREKHPHMHGEDNLQQLPFSFGRETPPHAWGRLDRPQTLQGFFRNTPTCMGKTALRCVRGSTRWKHPHMHGEDSDFNESEISWMETPPHAWGRRCTVISICNRHGNTPTCMGKTYSYLCCITFPWKHPHMHGEDAITFV